MSGKFKFQVQDSDLEYLFWRFDKKFALSEKKATFIRPCQNILKWLWNDTKMDSSEGFQNVD